MGSGPKVVEVEILEEEQVGGWVGQVRAKAKHPVLAQESPRVAEAVVVLVVAVVAGMSSDFAGVGLHRLGVMVSVVPKESEMEGSGSGR
mmetsp:Transcript_37950/g.80360  ORF Transcript_37950/g.80360 Transcript_37950/m.80360 type:complete len:89 (+) Transcript_37950:226-492(+)